MISKLITPNIVRALQKIQKDPQSAELLVDPDYLEDLFTVLRISGNANGIGIDDVDSLELKKEFASTYAILKSMLKDLSKQQVKSIDDLKILNSAQKFLEFILKNEATLNGIESVKVFKEAIFSVLDEEDIMLRDKVINRLNELTL